MKHTFKILKFSKPYWRLIVLNTVFNILSVIFSLFSISLIIPILGLLFGTIEPPDNINTELNANNLKAYFYSYIYSLLTKNGVLYALGFICFLVTCGTILKNITRYIALCFLTPIRNNVIRDIRKRMYANMLEMPLKSIRKFKKGDIVARMTNDLTEIEWSIMGVLELLIKNPIHIVIFLISLIYISPQLTMISFIFLPFGALIITQVSKSLKQQSLQSQNKFGELISLIEESISNIKIVKSFNASNFLNKKFNSENEDLKHINNHVLWRKDLASPMSEMLSTLVMVAIIWFGGKIVLTSSLQPDSFIGFLIIFSQILPPAKSLTTAFYSIQKGSAAAKRVLNILDVPIDHNLPYVKNFTTNILFKDVCFKHDEEINLKNINLTINKGDRVAIVGESGAGKSTLVELLLNLYKTSSGSISVDGKNINDANHRRLFGLVTQDSMLFNDTIKDNLMIGNPGATSSEIESALKLANIDSFTTQLDKGYETIIEGRGDNLSGGEKQRIGIARALLSNAPILIFDEPTSALDSESHNYIQQTLKNLHSSKTLIIITHKLKSIEKFDRIIIMKKGEIVGQGNHEFLLKNNGIYKKLYQTETLKENEKN